MQRRNTWLVVALSPLWAGPLEWGCGAASPALSTANGAAPSTPVASASVAPAPIAQNGRQPADVAGPIKVEQTTGARAVSKRPKATSGSCDPPWHVDSANIRRLKLECL